MCVTAFPKISSLKMHMKFHKNKGKIFLKIEKPYSCEVCELAFSHHSTLRDHWRTHTGEKPYSCDVCGSAFTWRANFISHMKIHTFRKKSPNSSTPF